MQQPKTYEVEQIDEVEEVRLQFSKFFKQTTDNSHMNIPSKLENILSYFLAIVFRKEINLLSLLN